SERTKRPSARGGGWITGPSVAGSWPLRSGCRSALAFGVDPGLEPLHDRIAVGQCLDRVLRVRLPLRGQQVGALGLVLEVDPEAGLRAGALRIFGDAAEIHRLDGGGRALAAGLGGVAADARSLADDGARLDAAVLLHLVGVAEDVDLGPHRGD